MDPFRPLLPWLIAHAGELRNHYQFGIDGLTTTERNRGRSVEQMLYEKRESELIVPLFSRPSDKPRPTAGVYLGIRGRSGQA